MTINIKASSVQKIKLAGLFKYRLKAERLMLNASSRISKLFTLLHAREVSAIKPLKHSACALCVLPFIFGVTVYLLSALGLRLLAVLLVAYG